MQTRTDMERVCSSLRPTTGSIDPKRSGFGKVRGSLLLRLAIRRHQTNRSRLPAYLRCLELRMDPGRLRSFHSPTDFWIAPQPLSSADGTRKICGYAHTRYVSRPRISRKLHAREPIIAQKVFPGSIDPSVVRGPYKDTVSVFPGLDQTRRKRHGVRRPPSRETGRPNRLWVLERNARLAESGSAWTSSDSASRQYAAGHGGERPDIEAR